MREEALFRYLPVASRSRADGAPAGSASGANYEALVRHATGVSTTVTSSKRVCTCHGGTLDGSAGIAIVDVSPQQRAVIECIVPRFATDGHELDELGCAATGGSVEMLGR